MCYAITYQNKTFYTILYICIFGKFKLVNMLGFHEMGKSRKRYGQTEVFFYLQEYGKYVCECVKGLSFC